MGRGARGTPVFAYDLRIDESDIGDTAFFDPYSQAMIHYKRDRYFLFGGQVGAGVPEDGAGIRQYACGEKGFRGAEGTWRDAEDGLLSGSAIAQGAVDSVVGYAATVPGRGEAILRTWMAAGETREEVTALQAALLRRGFEEALTETAAHDGTYALRRPDLDRLPPRVAALFTRSLLVIRTQADKRGAILASNDSDIMETAARTIRTCGRATARWCRLRSTAWVCPRSPARSLSSAPVFCRRTAPR